MLNALRHQRLWHSNFAELAWHQGSAFAVSWWIFSGTFETRTELNLFSLAAKNYATSLFRQNQAVWIVRGFISPCRFNGREFFPNDTSISPVGA